MTPLYGQAKSEQYNRLKLKTQIGKGSVGQVFTPGGVRQWGGHLMQKAAEERERDRRQVRRLRERMRLFVRSRLWLWVVPVAVLSFVIFFLFRLIDLRAMQALGWGGIAAGVAAACWAIGIWASTTSDEEVMKQAEEDAVSRWITSTGRRSRVGHVAMKALGILLALGALEQLVSPQIEQLVSEQGQVVRALTGILLKVQAIVLVFVPLFLTRGR